jgi:hypothetical protein
MKSSSQLVMKPKAKTRFQPHPYAQTPVVRKRSISKKNVSFEASPRSSHKQQRVGKIERPIVNHAQPVDYIEDEVQSQFMRESLSQIMPQKRKDLYPKSDIPEREIRIQQIDAINLKRRQKELEFERRVIENKERIKSPIQYEMAAGDTFGDRFNEYEQKNRSRSENRFQETSQEFEKLPSIISSRRNSETSKN